MLKSLCPTHLGKTNTGAWEIPYTHSYLLVGQGGTEMLLNVSLQNSVKVLEFPICNESYYIDLKRSQNYWGCSEGRVPTAGNYSPAKTEPLSQFFCPRDNPSNE